MKDGTVEYKVLIAEDELLVRVGLNITVPWESFGMKVVAVEEDGISAWESYQNLHPNIVLTDIRMPEMDGVELIRRIRESGEPCAIIVITCLEEFDILYRLMQMDITGYLIKATMVQEDVTNVLNKAIQKLIESGGLTSHMPSESKNIKDRNPLHELIFFHHDIELYLSDCKEMGPNVRHPQFCILIHWTEQLQAIVISSITNMFQKRLQQFGIVEAYSNDDYLFISLIDVVQRNADDLYELINELAQYVIDVLNVELRISLCETEEDVKKIAQFVEVGKEIVENPYFYPDNITFFEISTIEAHVESKLRNCISLLREQIFVMVPPLEYQRNKLLFQCFFDALQESICSDQQRFEHSLISLGELYFSTIDKADTPRELLKTLRTNIHESKTAYEAFRIFEKATIKCTNSLHPTYGKLMLNTMQHIRQQANNNITLMDLSAIVNLSPNYYSTLFKQMLGCSVSDYIGLVRIDKACDLMASCTYSIQQISVLCGFSDATYFSRFFKHKVGMSPHQWRTEK